MSQTATATKAGPTAPKDAGPTVPITAAASPPAKDAAAAADAGGDSDLSAMRNKKKPAPPVDLPIGPPRYLKSGSTISACMFNGKSYVFYVDHNQILRGYNNKEDLDEEPQSDDYRSNYDDNIQRIKDSKEPIRSRTRDIAAVSFIKSGGDTKDVNNIRSRIFYIDSEGYLAELKKNGLGKGWEKGALRNELAIQAAPNGPITAIASPIAEVVKVYYYVQKPDELQMHVAWQKKDKKWYTKPCVEQRV